MSVEDWRNIAEGNISENKNKIYFYESSPNPLVGIGLRQAATEDFNGTLVVLNPNLLGHDTSVVMSDVTPTSNVHRWSLIQELSDVSAVNKSLDPIVTSDGIIPEDPNAYREYDPNNPPPDPMA